MTTPQPLLALPMRLLQLLDFPEWSPVRAPQECPLKLTSLHLWLEESTTSPAKSIVVTHSLTRTTSKQMFLAIPCPSSLKSFPIPDQAEELGVMEQVFGHLSSVNLHRRWGNHFYIHFSVLISVKLASSWKSMQAEFLSILYYI